MILSALMIATAAHASAAVARSASASAPIAVLSEFSADAFPRLLMAVAANTGLAKVPVYIGQYGINEAHAAAIHALSNGRYAPIMTPFRKDHPARRLSAAELEKLGPSSKGFDGPIPTGLAGFTPYLQLHWGLELGRRLRDEIRAAERAGVRIDSWQFDEVSPTPASDLTQKGAVSRRYISGVMHGLCYGRPELGDKIMRGLVFISNPIAFAQLPDTEDARLLMWELDHVAFAILGEEYVKFQGDAKAAAQREARVQQALRAGGGDRVRLAGRYLPALTPGYIVSKHGKPTFLWGNVDNRSDGWVNAWRSAYAAERMRSGSAGMGEYDFTGNNARPEVITAAVAAVAAVAAGAARPR